MSKKFTDDEVLEMNEKYMDQLDKQIQTLEKYLLVKFEQKDWHGVWDAAIDLQRITDKIEGS